MAGNGRLKKILTIENKILLPFVFICVLAVTVLFFALYRFGRTGIVEEMSGIFYRQRYVVLGGIALLLIIVETAVLVSYNIAGPIRKLSEICSGISEAPALTEEENRELSEYAERSDEVGQLAEAFQKMIGSLGDYTRELAFVKNLNENIVRGDRPGRKGDLPERAGGSPPVSHRGDGCVRAESPGYRGRHAGTE